MTTQGPKSWESQGGTPALGLGMFFDGAFVRGGAYYPRGLTLEAVAGATLLQSLAGNSVQQSVWLGGDMPVNANPLRGRWQFKIATEADYQRFVNAEARGVAVELWLDLPAVEFWYIPGADAGATTWQTLRRQPWHIAGVTHATRPPKVLIDDVELTVVTSGPPGVGEVVVANSGGSIGTLTTNASDTSGATWLELRYHPVLLVAIKNVSREIADFNHIVVSAELVEHLEGAYTTPSGA